MNQPLANDATREAVDTMRGYSYQILRSVLDWIDLPDSELLYLEGAEDFDRIAGEAAITTQIKDTRKSGNLTLRSADALKAIDNYWLHRRRNPGRLIRFRYLTTSGVGTERGDPLGRRLPGIEVWRRSKQHDGTTRQAADLSALRSFLRAQAGLSGNLKKWLATCSNDELLRDLIAPIEWYAGAAETSAVLAEIRARLITFGSARSVPVRDSEAVIGALYFEAWRVATRDQERRLDRPGFVRVFEENTLVSIPKAQYTALIAKIVPVVEGSVPLPAIVGDNRAIELPPPLPPRYYRRPTLLAQIRAATVQSRVLVLQGSTGTSKTTTAAAFALDQGGTWGWISLRGLDIQSALRRLTAACAEMSAGIAPLNITIDDLDMGEDLRICESVLTRLSQVQRSRGGLVLFCAAQDPTPRLMQALGTGGLQIVRMPRFERQDIEGFLAERGCTDQDRRSAWAGIVELTTLGHPQLVHARVAVLEAARYPQPSAQDLLTTPADVLDARAEARKLLANLEPSARELIYRLSLTSQFLTRKQILAIAESTPAVAEPGNAFDQLFGPWLESVGHDQYWISPLVRNAGQEVNGEGWAQSTHGRIAWAMLRGRTRTPNDVSSILLHALAARDETAIARLAFGLLTAETEVWRAIGDAAFWIVFMGLNTSLESVIGDRGAQFLFRVVQFRIAAATDSDTAPTIVERILTEFPAEEETTRARVARHLVLGEALLRWSSTFTLTQLVNWAGLFILASDQLGDLLADKDSGHEDPQFAGPNGTRDFATAAGFCLLHRVKNRADLADLLAGLKAWNDALIVRTFRLVRDDDFVARLVLNGVWLAEFRAEVPAWPELLDNYEEVYALASRGESDGLARATAKIIARMLDEEFHLPAKALDRAAVFAAELGDSPTLQDGRARILARAGDDAAALELWRSALPNWRTDESDIAPSYSYRDAALAAARLTRWAEAADLFVAGADRGVSVEPAAFRIGMLVDSAFARWKARDNIGALAHFAIALRELDPLQDKVETEPLFSVQKRAGHTLMWVTASTSGRPPESFSEPFAGCCSNLEQPMIDDRPPQTPIDFLLCDLARFEQAIGAGDEQLQLSANRLKTSPYLTVRVVALELVLRWRLRYLHMEGYMTDVAAFVGSLAIAQQMHAAGETGGLRKTPSDLTPTLAADHHDLMRSHLLFAVIALIARGILNEAVITAWRHEVIAANVDDVVHDSLELIQGLFVSSQIDAGEIMHRSGIDWTAQSLATLRSAIDPDVSPSLLIQCHGLWLYYLARRPDRDWIGDDVAILVAQGWSRCTDRPFLLIAPRTSIPALREAIAGRLQGWTRVKRIVTAALDTVRYDVGARTRETLASLPD